MAELEDVHYRLRFPAPLAAAGRWSTGVFRQLALEPRAADGDQGVVTLCRMNIFGLEPFGTLKV